MTVAFDRDEALPGHSIEELYLSYNDLTMIVLALVLAQDELQDSVRAARLMKRIAAFID